MVHSRADAAYAQLLSVLLSYAAKQGHFLRMVCHAPFGHRSPSACRVGLPFGLVPCDKLPVDDVLRNKQILLRCCTRFCFCWAFSIHQVNWRRHTSTKHETGVLIWRYDAIVGARVTLVASSIKFLVPVASAWYL